MFSKFQKNFLFLRHCRHNITLYDDMLSTLYSTFSYKCWHVCIQISYGLRKQHIFNTAVSVLSWLEKFCKKLLLNQYKLMLSSLEHVSSIELGFLSRCFYFLCLLFIVVYNCMVYSVEDYRQTTNLNAIHVHHVCLYK